MAGKKFIVFLGSTREGRQGEKVARYVTSLLEKAGVSTKIFGKSLILSQNQCNLFFLYNNMTLQIHWKWISK